MHTVYLGLGSNLGDRQKNIENAIMLLERDGVSVLKRSTIIETEPVDCPPLAEGCAQPKFFNSVIKGETALTPQALLKVISGIEHELGRERPFKNAPRTIDIDILLFDDLKMSTEELTIPHPRMHERDFVMRPLNEIVDRKDGEINRFDKAAQTWDQDQRRVKVANDIADVMIREVAFHRQMDVLDFGCGTGLISYRLRPLVNSITGMDSSAAMLAVMEQKAAKDGISNIKTYHLDIGKGKAIEGHYNAIVSSMTMHHIRDIDHVLSQFYSALVSNGILCLADLDQDNGLFHPDPVDVYHDGFDRKVLKNKIASAGFINIRDITAAEVVKPVAESSLKKFNIFLIIAEKGLKESR
jgi:2-amino-4-hydroxy-6-hydroxymethyldihydropteridine diphosphokinase